MRRLPLGAFVLILFLPAALAADVDVRPHDPAAQGRAGAGAAPEDAAAAAKSDRLSDVLLVPFYEVDTTRPTGDTTLYAVRNVTNGAVALEVEYFGRGLDVLRQDLVSLGPRETLTVNVRDVAGLWVETDGFARGWIRIGVTSTEEADGLMGDFFTVDVAGNFASGDRLVAPEDLCRIQEIRFLDFGSGTELWMLIDDPRGSDPFTDASSFTVTPVTEDGSTLAPRDVFTDDAMLKLPAAFFTGLDFGTLVFDFSNSSGGYVFAKYSAEGKFSVGLNSACRVP